LFIYDECEKNIQDVFTALLEGKTNNWAGSYMVRVSSLFKFYPEREIYQSKYGQNLQLLLPLLYNKKCGFIDKPHMNYNQQENSLTKTNVEKSKKKKSLEKYGVEFILQSDEVREKIKQTNLEKYGVEHHLQNPEIYSKTKKTNLSKYGLEFPVMRVSSYTHKEYKWKTGEISMVQGHEPIVLSELEEKGYTEHEVLTSVKDVPEIWYEVEGKKKRYFPDIYIPSENLIIEVKSQYILNKELEINLLKFQAVKDAGYEFRLEVR
jgi:hypothetical protein